YTSPFGRTRTLAYDAQGRIDSMVTPRIGGGTIATDFQYDAATGQLSRIVVGDSSSGYRVPKDLAYYPVAAGDVKSGYVQTRKTGSTTSPAPGTLTTAILTWSETPDAFGRSVSEALGGQTTQFGWFGDGQLSAVTTPAPNSNHHNFSFTPTTTTYS